MTSDDVGTELRRLRRLEGERQFHCELHSGVSPSRATRSSRASAARSRSGTEWSISPTRTERHACNSSKHFPSRSSTRTIAASVRPVAACASLRGHRKEGYRVVSGISYDDAERIARIFNNESCWLISIDGAEAAANQWERLEKLLGEKRHRNQRLPIFLFGDERTAEMVPAGVLRHANAFLRLFEDSPDFLARTITRSARAIYRGAAAADVPRVDGVHAGCQFLVAHAGTRRGSGLPQESRRPALLSEFFGENTVRSDISVSVGSLGSLLDHTGAIAAGERNAARIFGADHTLFVVGGASAANKIVWHGMVGPGDLVLCDRNCHKSILHSLVMTGATPIYLVPSRNGLGIIGPISRDQFTPASIKAKIAASPDGSGSHRQGSPHGDDQLDVRRALLQRRRHQEVAGRHRRGAPLRRGVVRLRELPRVLRRLSRDLVGASGPRRQLRSRLPRSRLTSCSRRSRRLRCCTS